MAADPPVWRYINARIQHKHDTATQWGLKPNFIPEAGEIIIYDADSTHDTRFKVGDGQTKISVLPFVTGVTSVNGQTGDVSLTIPTVPSNVSSFANDAGYLTSETDPTVPSWAKASSKPSYTASEVGAVPTSRKVNGNALSADVSLTASDVSAVPTSAIADTDALANDGILTEEGFDYATNGVAEEYQAVIPTVAQVEGMVFDASNSLQDMIPTSASQVGAVPTTRTVNGKALSSNISLTASDVGALPSSTTIPSKTSDLTNDSGFLTSYTETDPTVPSWAKASSKPSYTASEVGAVPTSRTVNGKALSSNISLTASDVGALPSSTSIPSKTSDLTNDSGFLTSIPTASSSTLGGVKVGDGLSISNGVLSVEGSGLPSVTSSDNGKFLRVSNGAWAVEAIAQAAGVNF